MKLEFTWQILMKLEFTWQILMKLEFTWQILMKLEFTWQIFRKPLKYQIRPVGADFHGDRRTDARTDMTKLIVAFHNFVNAGNKMTEFC